VIPCYRELPATTDRCPQLRVDWPVTLDKNSGQRGHAFRRSGCSSEKISLRAISDFQGALYGWFFAIFGAS
jgi:hypothetical protein